MSKTKNAFPPFDTDVMKINYVIREREISGDDTSIYILSASIKHFTNPI